MGGESKNLYKGNALILNLEQALYPDGTTETLEIIRHPGGAGAVAINSEHKVCLIRQYRYAIDAWLWEIPAGRIEHREDPLKTAQRELGEETGIIAEQWQSLGVMHPSPGICDERIFLYMAQGLIEEQPAHELTEFIEIHWVPFNEAIDWCENGKISDAKTIITLYRAAVILLK